jgi:hypothetical protein
MGSIGQLRKTVSVLYKQLNNSSGFRSQVTFLELTESTAFPHVLNDEVKRLENNRQEPDGSRFGVWYCLQKRRLIWYSTRHNAKMTGFILFFSTLSTSFYEKIAIVLPL